jgi:hypothetical protein
MTSLGMVRYQVLLALDIASRKLEILGAAVNPGGRMGGAADKGRLFDFTSRENTPWNWCNMEYV